MGQPVLSTEVLASKKEFIRDTFRQIKDLGIPLVLQVVSSDSSLNDWRAYLDVAAEEDIKVVTSFIENPPQWDGEKFDLGINEDYLLAMKDHPALFGFAILDEPYHQKHNRQFTSDRLQTLYNQVKDIAPNVKIMVQFSRELWKFGDNPNTAFKNNQCDICGVSSLEFRNYGEGNIFDKDSLTQNHITSRSILKKADSDGLISTFVQAFGSAGGGSSYYMPEPDEFQQMIDILLSDRLQDAGKLNILGFQTWRALDARADSGQLNLSKPEFSRHRDIIKKTCSNLN